MSWGREIVVSITYQKLIYLSSTIRKNDFFSKSLLTYSARAMNQVQLTTTTYKCMYK